MQSEFLPNLTSSPCASGKGKARQSSQTSTSSDMSPIVNIERDIRVDVTVDNENASIDQLEATKLDLI